MGTLTKTRINITEIRHYKILHMSESGEVRVVEMEDDFGDRKGRSTFATKVLVTVFIQFGVLAAVSNIFMYTFSDAILTWFKETGWFTMLIFGLSVPVILIVFLMKPNLMTQKPKNIFSLVFLTLILAAFTSMIAVYVTAKYKCDPKNPECASPEQVITSALYGVMVCILICLVLNWAMDMETQFKIMIGIQLVLGIASGFLFWFIFGFKIAYIAGTISFCLGIMTWMMFFLRMIFFADFLQDSADDMGVEEGIDSLWVYAAILFYVQICRLFLGLIRLILATRD